MGCGVSATGLAFGAGPWRLLKQRITPGALWLGPPVDCPKYTLSARR
jgi:hypothetical protein